MKYSVGGVCMVKLRAKVAGRSRAAAEEAALKQWKRLGWTSAVVVVSEPVPRSAGAKKKHADRKKARLKNRKA